MAAITLTPMLTTAPALPGAAPPVAAGAQGAFALLLQPEADPTRHSDAAPGKDVPVLVVDGEEPDMPELPMAPMALPWLPLPVAASPVQPPPAQYLPAEPPAAAPTALTAPPALTSPAAAAPALPASPTVPAVSGSVTPPPAVMAGIAAPAAAAADRAVVPPVAGEGLPSAPVGKGDPVLLPGRGEMTPTRGASASGGEAQPALRTHSPAPLPASAAVEPDVGPAAGPRIAPAAQVFAGAIRQALREEPAVHAPLAAAATPEATLRTVAAAGGAQGAPLDAHARDWPERMIERIEVLRDTANANDARIRLVPDALGAIDVQLRRDGDSVAVQFSAAQAETRQLLADAQPRLEALAESRGLKLAGGGAGGTGGEHGPPPRPQQSAGAVPQTSHGSDEDSTGDHRVA